MHFSRQSNYLFHYTDFHIHHLYKIQDIGPDLSSMIIDHGAINYHEDLNGVLVGLAKPTNFMLNRSFGPRSYYQTLSCKLRLLNADNREKNFWDNYPGTRALKY